MRDQVPRKCGHCDWLFQRPRWSLLQNFPEECFPAFVEPCPRMMNYLPCATVVVAQAYLVREAPLMRRGARRVRGGGRCMYGEPGRFVEDRATRFFVSWRRGLTYLLSLRVPKKRRFSRSVERRGPLRVVVWAGFFSCVWYVKPHGGVWPYPRTVFMCFECRERAKHILEYVN